MILSKTIDLFLGEYRGATHRTYRDDLMMLQHYIAGGIELSEVTVPEVLTAVQRYERRDTVNSPYTVNKFIRTTRRFFNWCVDMEFIDRSPARKTKFRPTPKDDVLDRTMPEQTYFALLDHFTEKVKWDKTALRMLALLHFLGTSSRRGGAVGLKWSDINFENREATITEKGDKQRTVFLDEETIHVLRRWQLQQKSIKGDYVFSMHGGRIYATSLSKFFRYQCERTGISEPHCGWGMHSIRHYVGIDLQDAGLNRFEASGIMGNSPDVYESFYASQDKDRLRELHQKTMRKRRMARGRINTNIDFLSGKSDTG